MAQALFIQQGSAIDYTPATDVAAGEVVVLGELIGVATTPITAGEQGALALEGVVECLTEEPSVDGFASVGDPAYWNTFDKWAQPAIDPSSQFMGHVVQLFNDTKVRVRLCPTKQPAAGA